MSSANNTVRLHRVLRAPPERVYRAFLDPKAWVAWLPPKGRTGRMHAFDARDGGSYRMTLTYDDPNHAARGKSSEYTDAVARRFVEFVPDERVAQTRLSRRR